MNLLNGLMKRLYWPGCRAYARHLGDRPADSVMRFLCGLEFRRTFGFWPDFVRPERFSEKIWSKQLHDRDPRLTMVSDKWRVRTFVARAVGCEVLVPLLWHGEDPEQLPFEQLPTRFVIKANHGCEYNIIVTDRSRLDHAAVVVKLKRWMNRNFGRDAGLGIAWSYTNIEPHIIVEEFLGGDDGPPVDYKFFCFSGRVEFFKVDVDRFGAHSARYFDKNLNPLELREVGFELSDGRVVLPGNIARMFAVAQILSKGFDFMRVDLYSVDGDIFFGELTPYPGGISNRLEPVTYDALFGDMWREASG